MVLKTNSRLSLRPWFPQLKYGVFIFLLAFIFAPTFLWMYQRWTATDSYFGHGFLIPLVSLYWIFKKKEVLKKIGPSPDLGLGTALLALGSFLQFVSFLLRIYFLSAFSFVIILIGLVILLFGRRIAREIAFPLLFLLLMVPLPLLVISEITLKMKFWASEMAAFLIAHTGVPAVREGSYIRTPHSILLVADPCSGLRSLLVFVVFGLIFAYESKRLPLWQRALILISSLPLALFSNVMRIWFLGLVGEVYGMGYTGPGAMPHEISGYMVFIVSFVGLIGIRSFMEKNYVKNR